MKVLNLEQGSKEWVEARRNHVTATEIAHLRSGFVSLYTLVGQKRGEIPVEDISNIPPVVEGKHFEPLIRRELARQLPFLLDAGKDDFPQPCVEAEDEPFFMASLDGYSHKGIVIEIKNIFSKRHSNFEEIRLNGLNAPIPMKYGYYWQVQWQLYVSGAQKALMAFHWSPEGVDIFHPENILIIQVSRNEETIKELKEIGYQVKDILTSGRQVAPSAEDTVFVNAATAEKVKPLLDEYRAVEEHYSQLQAEMDALKKRKSSIVSQLAENLFKGNESKVRGDGFALTRYERKGSVDVDRLISEGKISRELAEQYRKASSFSTRLTLS